MARESKLGRPSFAQHVVQRGLDGKSCFIAGEDYRYYVRCLRDASLAHDCAVHAYVLMENHIHLLLTPGYEDGVWWLMQDLDRSYVRYVARKYRRNRALWAGRYKASLIGTDEYLLAHYCYVERNPVRAGCVRYASQYRWSSFLCNAMGCADPLVQPHPSYWALADTERSRQQVYRALFRRHAADDRSAEIRQALDQESLLGGNAAPHMQNWRNASGN